MAPVVSRPEKIADFVAMLKRHEAPYSNGPAGEKKR